MAYADKVDIRFSLQVINAFKNDVESMRGQADSLRHEVVSSYQTAEKYIEEKIKYIKDCQDINNTDADNARKFSQSLQKAIWDTEKELEKRERLCNELYEAKSKAYNHYDSVKSKASNDKPGTMEAASRAWDAYERARKAYDDACTERDACKSRLDALKRAENDMYWVHDKIHKDYIELSEEESFFNRLSNDLRHAYERFCSQYKKAANEIELVLGHTATAYNHANRAVNIIGEMHGKSVGTSNEIDITSISAVYRTSERMDSVNEANREQDKEAKRQVERYNELIIDNIMPAVREAYRDISKTVTRVLEANERKASLMKDLAQALQNYYDVV